MKKLSEPEKAYLAGIIDGEGHITITHIKNHRISDQYASMLGVTNTDIRLMNWLKGCLGGNFYKLKVTNPKHHKTRYEWKLRCNKAAKQLKEIRHYLKLKQKQADNVIELQELMSEGQALSAKGGKFGQFRSKERTELYHQIYLNNKELNKKGPPATTERIDGLIAEATV